MGDAVTACSACGALPCDWTQRPSTLDARTIEACAEVAYGLAELVMDAGLNSEGKRWAVDAALDIAAAIRALEADKAALVIERDSARELRLIEQLRNAVSATFAKHGRNIA